jgi:hypothetical protein
MAHLSLEKRCELIKQKYGHPSLSRFLLKIIYKKHGIRYVKPYYIYARKH